ncbi:hypothetical protein [Nocardia sp. NPDC050793]|uniref:hypothetical protein n=1 Tax=Nocardia sp. NPDC050793 TaxID=3155159 RepID=UPI003405CAD8
MGSAVSRQLADLMRAGLAALLALGFGWTAAVLVPLYEFLVEDGQPGSRYLPVAYGIAWTGIAGAGVAAAVLVVSKLRTRSAIGWTPLVAIPLIIESWLLGCLVALVLGSI